MPRRNRNGGRRATFDIEPTSKVKGHKKRVIAGRDGWICHYCNRPLTELTATLDHVIARARGGANAVRNLVLACRPCNHAKSDRCYGGFVRRPR